MYVMGEDTPREEHVAVITKSSGSVPAALFNLYLIVIATSFVMI